MRRIANGLVVAGALGLITISAQAPTGQGPAPVVSSSHSGGFITTGGVFAGPGLFPDGTNALPGMSWASDPDTGYMHPAGANNFNVVFGGAVREYHGATLTVLGSGVSLGWANNADPFVGSMDTSISRAAAGELTYTAVLFAALGTPANGTFAYCSDCLAQSTPCTGASTGALAKRLNGAWDCR